MRRLIDALGGDDIAAGIGTLALRDPDLPIDVLVAERQVVAFRAADHAAAKVLDVDHVGHQRVVDIRQQQVGAGHGPLVFVPQLVDQMVDRAGRIDLGIEIGVLAEQRQRLAVEDQLDIGKTAGARGAELVGPAEIDRAGTRQQEFLVILGDDLEIGVVAERYGLLRRQIVGHRLEQALGVGLRRPSLAEGGPQATTKISADTRSQKLPPICGPFSVISQFLH